MFTCRSNPALERRDLRAAAPHLVAEVGELDVVTALVPALAGLLEGVPLPHEGAERLPAVGGHLPGGVEPRDLPEALLELALDEVGERPDLHLGEDILGGLLAALDAAAAPVAGRSAEYEVLGHDLFEGDAGV